ncbi:MAG: flagellar hook-associated protein FlgK [Clostridia bacterium]|jgi:flagellar hook-associated protein 1 FlgK|nr:flagellar hook-associated protein FlgK [Clostridia bacterium]
MGLASLTSAFSGMEASRIGIEVTGHNIANINTSGYTRQQMIQADGIYNYSYGDQNQILSIGTGTSVDSIRQVRNSFLDKEYQTESGRYGFYQAKAQVIDELETIFKDIDQNGFNQSMIDLKNSLNELSKNPDSLEARASFIQASVNFVDKAEYSWGQIETYQRDLNEEVENEVKRINTLTKEISELNSQIVLYEISGDNANDYRDTRNSKLDELSSLIGIEYKEDKTGSVVVFAEGNLLISDGFANQIELEMIGGNPNFMKPVWADSRTDVFDLSKPVSAELGNDTGKLKGVLKMRGSAAANYSTDPASIEGELIPNLQRDFDILIHDMVTMINDTVAPQNHMNGPKGLDGSQYIEIFKRKPVDRYDGSGNYNAENPLAAETLYSAGNIEVNPELLKNYSKIPLSVNDDRGDNSLVEKIITTWEEDRLTSDPTGGTKTGYFKYYNEMVSGIGLEGTQIKSTFRNQEKLLAQIDNQRLRVSAVSMDEELSEMMKYQHAYSAAAKVASTVDSMIETLIFRLGK